eukprot:CAMPEP_0184540604 /NCGR_PEP_ID=MMETSP0199_2-20130426/803_1 /TAXON_ID=1112570 /ORGANISM="Thraustochytrium sp., Strain LLF1b" /LENGTH=63 /DNA_ID=CAMNT_0026934231 /DNA_START=49 /DNA_END=237 /DNA_ORIENTATION=-
MATGASPWIQVAGDSVATSAEVKPAQQSTPTNAAGAQAAPAIAAVVLGCALACSTTAPVDFAV